MSSVHLPTEGRGHTLAFNCIYLLLGFYWCHHISTILLLFLYFSLSFLHWSSAWFVRMITWWIGESKVPVPVSSLEQANPQWHQNVFFFTLKGKSHVIWQQHYITVTVWQHLVSIFQRLHRAMHTHILEVHCSIL